MKATADENFLTHEKFKNAFLTYPSYERAGGKNLNGIRQKNNEPWIMIRGENATKKFVRL
ncbi:MAG: hypothetical protein RLZZ553_874 [Verrucomicrobiota bacterium]|jgi:hypothetical protein